MNGVRCEYRTAMPPNGSTQITCPAVYPPVRGGGTIRAQIQVEATAFGKAEIDQLLQVVADHAANIRGLPPTERPGGGQFVVKKARNMGGSGARVNAEYQSQITGLPVSIEYLIQDPAIKNRSHSVSYDGIDYPSRLLEEVKGQHAQLISQGRFFHEYIAPSLIDEIRNQIEGLPSGYRLRITFLEPETMATFTEMYRRAGVDLSRVIIRHVPKEQR